MSYERIIKESVRLIKERCNYFVNHIITRVVLSLMVFILLLGCVELPDRMVRVKFETNSCIIPHDNYSYLTCHPILVDVASREILIPGGFDTDLASIPRWYWIFLSPARSSFIGPSILHDYLYLCPFGYSRRAVDNIFYSALRQNGVSTYTALKMYIAVRLFGSNSYHADSHC